MRPDTDVFLVWRISRWSDRKAANDLMEKYYREIYAFTYRQTLEKQLAMDLTQEIFISVLQSVGGFEPKKGSFRTWLYRIASRRVADYYRSRCYHMGRLMQPIDGELPQRDDMLASRLEDREAARMVLEQISTFDGVTQQILRLPHTHTQGSGAHGFGTDQHVRRSHAANPAPTAVRGTDVSTDCAGCLPAGGNGKKPLLRRN